MFAPAFENAVAEERVWRWVCAQQGLERDDNDDAMCAWPDVEDESARLRSCFSDASSDADDRSACDQEEEEDHEFVLGSNDDDEAVVTLDELVCEIDAWLARPNGTRIVLAEHVQPPAPAPLPEARKRLRAATMPSLFLRDAALSPAPAQPVPVPVPVLARRRLYRSRRRPHRASQFGLGLGRRRFPKRA